MNTRWSAGCLWVMVAGFGTVFVALGLSSIIGAANAAGRSVRPPPPWTAGQVASAHEIFVADRRAAVDRGPIRAGEEPDAVRAVVVDLVVGEAGRPASIIVYPDGRARALVDWPAGSLERYPPRLGQSADVVFRKSVESLTQMTPSDGRAPEDRLMAIHVIRADGVWSVEGTPDQLTARSLPLGKAVAAAGGLARHIAPLEPRPSEPSRPKDRKSLLDFLLNPMDPGPGMTPRARRYGA